jgi:hypothetical protein
VAVAQHRRESANFRSDVVYGPFIGGAGERGMSQFTPGTWARFGSGHHTTAYDPDASLAAWAAYTGYLMRLFNGDYTKVLQGYNGGEGHVQRGTVSSAAQRYAREILAEAGQMPSTPTPTPTPDDTAPSPTGGGPNWTLIIAVGAIAVIALVALGDDD